MTWHETIEGCGYWRELGVVSPHSLDSKQFDVHLMTRPEFVDKNVILSGAWVGQPRGLVSARIPLKVFCCHMAVFVFSRLTSFAAANIQTKFQRAPIKQIQLYVI